MEAKVLRIKEESLWYFIEKYTIHKRPQRGENGHHEDPIYLMRTGLLTDSMYEGQIIEVEIDDHGAKSSENMQVVLSYKVEAYDALLNKIKFIETD